MSIAGAEGRLSWRSLPFVGKFLRVGIILMPKLHSQTCHLLRLKRKFKLKSKREGISEHNVVDDRPKSVTRERRSAELIGHLASNDDIMTRHRRLNNDTNQKHYLRRRHLDRPASGSTRKSRQSDVHPRSSRSHSTSRKSKSRPKAESDQKTKRRERRRTKEEAADAERRRRRRRDREMNRSKHPRDS